METPEMQILKARAIKYRAQLMRAFADAIDPEGATTFSSAARPQPRAAAETPSGYARPPKRPTKRSQAGNNSQPNKQETKI